MATMEGNQNQVKKWMPNALLDCTMVSADVSQSVCISIVAVARQFMHGTRGRVVLEGSLNNPTSARCWLTQGEIVTLNL